MSKVALASFPFALSIDYWGWTAPQSLLGIGNVSTAGNDVVEDVNEEVVVKDLAKEAVEDKTAKLDVVDRLELLRAVSPVSNKAQKRRKKKKKKSL